MHRPTVAITCRTSVVLVFLTTLSLAGTGAWPRLGLALALAAVWVAPFLVRQPGPRAADAPPSTAEGLAPA